MKLRPIPFRQVFTTLISKMIKPYILAALPRKRVTRCLKLALLRALKLFYPNIFFPKSYDRNLNWCIVLDLSVFLLCFRCFWWHQRHLCYLVFNRLSESTVTKVIFVFDNSVTSLFPLKALLDFRLHIHPHLANITFYQISNIK